MSNWYLVLSAARLTLKVKVGTYRWESWRVSENKGFGYKGDDVTWSIDVNWYVSRGGNLRCCNSLNLFLRVNKAGITPPGYVCQSLSKLDNPYCAGTFRDVYIWSWLTCMESGTDLLKVWFCRFICWDLLSYFSLFTISITIYIWYLPCATPSKPWQLLMAAPNAVEALRARCCPQWARIYHHSLRSTCVFLLLVC